MNSQDDEIGLQLEYKMLLALYYTLALHYQSKGASGSKLQGSCL